MSKYTPGVSWTVGETISERKLNQMVSNIDYLHQNRVSAQYRAHGITRTQVRVAAGITAAGPRKNEVIFRDIYFGNFFSSGCRPVVTTTFASQHNGRTFATIRGLGSNGYQTSHNGFRCVIASQLMPNQKFTFGSTVHVHWIAVGW